MSMLASVIGLLQQESIHPTPLASSKQQPKAEGEAGEKQMRQKQGETSESWGLAEADVFMPYISLVAIHLLITSFTAFGLR